MSNLTFAKLVATPTEASWSQVYNAGNLFASLSLSKKSEDDNISLQVVGKDIFSNIEAEFFTLEEKSLTTIKQALENSLKIIPENVEANLCLTYFKENVLYLFIYGAGTIIMKRNNRIGTLLEKPIRQAQGKLNNSLDIATSSGFLQKNDTIILQTPQFAQDMSMDAVTSSLDLNKPEDIAEALSPTMHEKNDGGQAAIIVNYQEDTKAEAEEKETENEVTLNLRTETLSEDAINEQIQEEAETLNINELVSPEPLSRHEPKKSVLSKLQLPSFLKIQFLSRLNHRKKLFLSIACIILALLFVSVLLTKKKESDKKTAVLFESIYNPALKDYQDGLDIQSINKSFAREDFLKAEKILKENGSKFKKGTSEEKKITDLLAKIEAELGGSASVAVTKPKEVTLADNDLLSIEKENSDGIAFARGKDSVYFLTRSAIVSVDTSGDKKDVIKNDDDWDKAVGLSTYQGNIYILDQAEGVLKFTAGADGFGKTSYFKEKPNLGSAQAIAIDGSVWILFKDGTILKYTRGVSDGFKVSALDKPFKNPIKIVTDIDTENLYVLDSGNSRIVKLSKTGSFENQYKADILKSAKDFEVSEKDGKILVLSGGKTWEIPL